MLKLWLFRIITILALLIMLFASDFSVGLFHEISTTRQIMGAFRSEVARLNTSTNHLIPNLNHKYVVDDMPNADVRYVRTDEYGLIKGAEEVNDTSATKILFLGGSTTENNEVDEPYRFPYLAAHQLSEILSKRFEGINAGVRAHTTQDSLNLYLNHPSPDIFDAKIVIVMHNINDRLRLAMFDSYKSSLNKYSYISFDGVKGSLRDFFVSTWLYFKFKSNIIFLIDAVSDRFYFSKKAQGIVVNERVLDQVTTITDKQLAAFSQNLRLLISVIRTREKIPMLMTQPLGEKSEGQDTFNEAIRTVALQEKVNLIDLDRELLNIQQPDRLFLSDKIHFNNEGSKWAAGVIANTLKNFNLVKAQ